MKIGPFDLDKDGVFIIAELSANHNGSLQTALDTISAAKEIGANAIKLQTYTADTITLNSSTKDFVISQGTLWDGKSLYELYQEAHTPWEWHETLFQHAREIGIDIFSSPFDQSAVDFLQQFNPSAYKIASFEITDYELVKYTASKGKPILISTGIATAEEISDVVNICRAAGNNEIVLLRCTSAYPAPAEDANLLMIPSLKQEFGVEPGFSDHTLGITAPVVATALGAKVIEKHFILDKKVGGADSEFSLDKKEFSTMVRAVRRAEKLLGEVDYKLTEKKQKNREHSRSLYASKPIKAGELLTSDNIKSVRPGFGLHPKHFQRVIGKKASRDIAFATALKNEDILGR